MRRAGLVLMVLGLVFLAAAGSLTARNRAEDTQAGAASARALAAMEAVIAAPSDPEDPPPEEPGFLGRLTIPVLELELPVLSQWSYENLKTAPCRYSGSAEAGDLVLLAHNYRTHFGPIRRLKPGDRVIFEDMEGERFEYLVTSTEVAAPTALAEVTERCHDLKLLTCTYGGKARLVVYCDAIAK